MAEPQKSAKDGLRLAPMSPPDRKENRPRSRVLTDIPSKFLGAVRKPRGAGDVVSVCGSEFRLIRQVGGQDGEVRGKNETWKAKTVGVEERNVFLKKFNSPRYPTDNEINDTTEGPRAKKNFDEFEEHHRSIMNILGNDRAGTGALVKPIVCGRPSDSLTFVKVYPWVSKGNVLDQNRVRYWKETERIIFIRTLCLAIWELHSRGIVHGDIKAENVVVVEMPIGPVARLIDFDDSYLASNPPRTYEKLFVGTTVSTPEWAILLDPTRARKGMSMALGLHTDIFQLSVMLNLVFSESGIKRKMPSESSPPISDVAKEVLDGVPLTCSELNTNNLYLSQQLELSLNLNPKRRPSIASILSTLGVSIK